MSFQYYKSATLAESQSGTADSTDWVLTIGVGTGPQAADADLKTTGNGGFVENSNGYDIRPYDGIGGSALTYELVYYDGTTGSLEMHVKIPTLSASTDTVIYLYFGDSGISTDGSSTNTWSANYEGVWHFPDGSSLSGLDSTANNNDATGGNAVAGEIDGGVETTSSGRNIVSVGTGTNLDPGAGDFTIGGWVYKYEASVSFQDLWFLAKWNTGASPGTNEYVLNVSDTGDDDNPIFFVEVSNTSYGVVYGTPLSEDTWYHLVGVRQGRGLYLYLNGSLVASNATVLPDSSTINTPGRNLKFGDSDITPNLALDGKMDEIFYNSSALSASWIIADYNSQKASSTFITWGTKVAVGGGSVVKTIDGEPVAEIKTIDGEPVAEIKTLMGAAYQ